MKQEYTEDKQVTLKPVSSGRRLLEVLLLLSGACSLYLLVALVSFNPADPSWSQTAGDQPIHNYGGSFGAWIADILLFTFGVLAYAVPIVILLLSGFIFRQSHRTTKTDFFVPALRIIGALALIITSCGLAAFNADDIYYFASGGVIGSLLDNAMQPWLNNLGATLTLLGIWAAGLTLFTGWSWLTIAEKIGAMVFGLLTVFTYRSRRNNTFIDDEKESIRQQREPSMALDDPLFSTSVIDPQEKSISPVGFQAATTQLFLAGIKIEPQNSQSTDSVEPMMGSIPEKAEGLFTLAEKQPLFTLPSTAKTERQTSNTTSTPISTATQRELASYGIKLPSQRTAQVQTDQEQDAIQQDQLRREFEARQTARYDRASSAKDQPESDVVTSASLTEVLSDTGVDDPNQLDMNSLIHPFLLRHGHDQPLPKPTTPLPTLELLTPPPMTEQPVNRVELNQIARLIETRLADYRVKAEVVGIEPGPVVTRFELELAPGVKAARISSLSRDLARSLSAVAVRVVEVIPGKPYVGLELPNKHRQTVYLREVLDCHRFRETTSPLAIVLGKDISGQPVVADLAKMPHLLVAGTTGSGKSVGVNAMIISILYKAKPEDVRFIMIDPKMLELSVYEGIPHLLTEVVTDMKDAANALRWCVNEMERRYKLMSALGVRNLSGYNERIMQAETLGRPIPDPFWKPSDGMAIAPPLLEKLPYIVVMVDEFADLIMAVGKKIEELIARLAQKARAAGIHLVLATQRPSVDVITGLIKANIPTRIAFTVSSKIDSRTILDQGGAESLLGMGDMLYLPPNSSLPVRVHGAFVRDQEVHAVVQDWKARGQPQYIDGIIASAEETETSAASVDGEQLDALFDQAVAFVIEKRRASISGVQRQFRIGYNRAARIIEDMEAQNIVSAPGHSGNREVLAPPVHE